LLMLKTEALREEQLLPLLSLRSLRLSLRSPYREMTFDSNVTSSEPSPENPEDR